MLRSTITVRLLPISVLLGVLALAACGGSYEPATEGVTARTFTTPEANSVEQAESQELETRTIEREAKNEKPKKQKPKQKKGTSKLPTEKDIKNCESLPSDLAERCFAGIAEASAEAGLEAMHESQQAEAQAKLDEHIQDLIGYCQGGEPKACELLELLTGG